MFCVPDVADTVPSSSVQPANVLGGFVEAARRVLGRGACLRSPQKNRAFRQRAVAQQGHLATAPIRTLLWRDEVQRVTADELGSVLCTSERYRGVVHPEDDAHAMDDHRMRQLDQRPTQGL